MSTIPTITPNQVKATDQDWINAIRLYQEGNKQLNTVTKVAHLLGFSPSYVSLVFQGKRKPHLTEGCPIARPKRQRYNQHTGYHPRPTTDQAKVQRILDKCSPNNLTDPSTTGQSCWTWQGYQDSRGRAMTYHQGKAITVQRKLYTLLDKPVPPRGQPYQVIPKCGNKLCCNPAHLEAKLAR